jgi:predicted alpha/beta hydrolase
VAKLHYAQFCGRALARAHAKSGDAAVISGYVGGGGRLGDALALFARDYADRAEQDHALLLAAIRSGRVRAESGV